MQGGDAKGRARWLCILYIMCEFSNVVQSLRHWRPCIFLLNQGDKAGSRGDKGLSTLDLNDELGIPGEILEYVALVIF
jgi:hypothetical protein